MQYFLFFSFPQKASYFEKKKITSLFFFFSSFSVWMTALPEQHTRFETPPKKNKLERIDKMKRVLLCYYALFLTMCIPGRRCWYVSKRQSLENRRIMIGNLSTKMAHHQVLKLLRYPVRLHCLHACFCNISSNVLLCLVSCFLIIPLLVHRNSRR